MTKRYQGNIITSNPVDPAGPYENSAAPGVWSLAEAFAYTKAGLWPTAGNSAEFGLFSGGQTSGGTVDTIQKIIIPTTGNATDFGNLTVTARYLYSMASDTRAVFAKGQSDDTISYVTVATEGDATDFGDMTTQTYLGGGSSNQTRGLMNGGLGYNQGERIQYLTIASTGNTTTFGDLSPGGTDRYGTASSASPTRSVNFGRWQSNVIDYVTIATTGNATDFGNLTVTTVYGASCSSDTRGLMMGGYSFDVGGGSALNIISYVTIASTGNATDFGDLTESKRLNEAALSSNTRGVRGGGDSSTNVIDYVTIATTGNATDFGDLLALNEGPSGCSNAHGGLQ